MQRMKKTSVFLIVSLLIVGIAVFSDQLGIHQGWSKSRSALLTFGIFVGLIPWIQGRRVQAHEEIIRNDLFAFPVLLIVIAIYLWFMSVSHRLTSTYYALLGESFRQ